MNKDHLKPTETFKTSLFQFNKVLLCLLETLTSRSGSLLLPVSLP